MKTKWCRSLLFMSLLAVVAGCEKNEKEESEDLQTIGNLIVTSNSAELNRRVTMQDELMWVEPIEASTLKSASEIAQVDLRKNYAFKLVAEVAPPQFEGHTLQATHVKIVDKYAYVTYNTKGDKYLGGLEVFDVSDVTNPQIVWHAVFPNADVSAVDYYNKKIYIVGATNPDEKGYEFESPAFLEVLSLDDQYAITGVDKMVDVSSYVGTGVGVCSSGVFVASGSDGGMSYFNHDLNLVYENKLPDVRDIALTCNDLFVLTGQPGAVGHYQLANNVLVGSYPVAGDLQSEAKSGIDATDKYVFTALNYDGMKMLNADGALKQHIAAPLVPEGKDRNNYVTNSVSVNGDLVLMANGEAGIYIGGMIESLDDEVVMLGAVKFGEAQSANYVESKDDVIFVATGTGGLKILAISVDQGVPDDIIPTKPCETLYSSIIDMFPEYVDNQKAHADLFGDQVTTNLLINQETDVYITFVDEGAGWKNTFGYYAYPADNPPTTVDQLQCHYVYPNVSKINEGGGLNTGDMVRLGTEKFPANTVIGFFLIAQGWQNGHVANGLYTLYTNTEFNTNYYQQHTLFIESSCDDLVMTLEDVVLNSDLSYNDKDFNDIIFTIKDNRDGKANSCFNVDNIPRK
ncbi:MAG: DUF4114 domain-containing protein [Marinilabiliaceae bacterium]|nr:DUF4114 domain-containing protein [Marinilabiliaceae bacterium]